MVLIVLSDFGHGGVGKPAHPSRVIFSIPQHSIVLYRRSTARFAFAFRAFLFPIAKRA